MLDPIIAVLDSVKDEVECRKAAESGSAAAAAAAAAAGRLTLKQVAAAARAAANAAKAMPAGLGRSGYLADETVFGREEPGCELFAMLLEAAASVQ